MSTSVKCRGCGTNFKIEGTGGICPVCDKLHKEPHADAGKAKGAKSAAKSAPAKPAAAKKCPVCGKSLAPGVKFCAACGTNVGMADAGDAFVASSKLDEQLEKTRWGVFFSRMFRWW
jgi:hypothetical protein